MNNTEITKDRLDLLTGRNPGSEGRMEPKPLSFYWQRAPGVAAKPFWERVEFRLLVSSIAGAAAILALTAR